MHWDQMAMKHQVCMWAQTLKTEMGSGKNDLSQAHDGAGDGLQASTNHWWWPGAVCWLLGDPHDPTWWSAALAAWARWPKVEMNTVQSWTSAMSKLPSFSSINCFQKALLLYCMQHS